MISWCKTKLGDCCEIISGSTPSTNVESFWNGSICWATPKDLSQLDGAYISDTPRKLTQSGLDSCGATILPSNSVLFSSRAPIGHVAVNTVPMATNQGFKSFVPKDNRVYAKFLYHWLRKNRAYLESLGNGATFKEVSKTIVSRVEILLPSLEEQKRIAEILDRAEELRSKRREAIAQLNTLNQAIFLEMFGDPLSNPNGFPIQKLGELCSRVIDCPHSTPTYATKITPYACVRSSDIQSSELVFSDVKYLELEEYKKRIERGVPQQGDVIYCREGARFGNAALLTDDTPLICLGQRMMLFRPETSKANGEFIWGYLSNPIAYHQALREVGGSASPHINIRDIRAFQIPVPPLNRQCEFAQRISAVNKLKIAHRTSLSELDVLFSSLQHRAFRGEL
ncbi:restriction endonuclease subunit S [Microcoleus sp. POL10_C6]|uniref:restriction endonuclease subunit S n=1 Tax=Microcoleus sp. POL10_C6 TaxID=2818852 RepID=UPI002FD59289